MKFQDLFYALHPVFSYDHYNKRNKKLYKYDGNFTKYRIGIYHGRNLFQPVDS
jgi:hypothetical protein